jgi:uncharacterized protein (DUF952 family)
MLSLFHITSRREWELARRIGEYRPGTFAHDGFVHCSYASQVVHVANRLFRGRTDLVLFEIDRLQLACDVIEENLNRGTELFPHVYGAVPMSAIVRVYPFPCNEDGGFTLPALESGSGHHQRLCVRSSSSTS